MLLVILAAVLLLVVVYLFKHPVRNSTTLTRIVQGALSALVVLLLTMTSYVIVDAEEVGHLKRIFLASDLPEGRIIATDGQKGPQAEILGPGFHLIPFVRILYEVEYKPVINIPQGQYGIVKAEDGRPLRNGQFIADPWPEEQFQQMLNARYFLTEGMGQKGPQLEVLRPGKYRLNQYLFKVRTAKALDVPTGHVAVIRSKVQEREDCPQSSGIAGGTNERAAAIIVPKGCVGVWEEPLKPGAYYLNALAYEPTIIPTRIQTWEYKGGYKERVVDLKLDDNGSITQTETSTELPIPKDAADGAINVRVEGWNVPVELRVIVQVHPDKAPIVVATVGNLDAVENKIITPTIRDILRTIGGHEERKVLDFMNKRDQIVKLVEDVISPEGEKAGVTIQEVRMGEPYIPPELLVAAQRENLANQLQQTYVKEQRAQKQRITVERERATADQQAQLVAAEIAKQAAAHRKEQLKLEGEGEKLKLMEIAKGQQAQANVLGKERAMQLQALEKALAAAVQNPEIVKIPGVLVQGTGSSLEGAAAILGASNLNQTMQGLREKEASARK